MYGKLDSSSSSPPFIPITYVVSYLYIFMWEVNVDVYVIIVFWLFFKEKNKIKVMEEYANRQDRLKSSTNNVLNGLITESFGPGKLMALKGI